MMADVGRGCGAREAGALNLAPGCGGGAWGPSGSAVGAGRRLVVARVGGGVGVAPWFAVALCGGFWGGGWWGGGGAWGFLCGGWGGVITVGASSGDHGGLGGIWGGASGRWASGVACWFRF